MLKRTLFFSTPMQLSLKNNKLVLNTREAPEDKREVPIEDIGFVVLESQMISITLPLLNALVANEVAVILCDERMMPSALLQPLVSNNVQAEKYRQQTDASEPLKKSLWKQTVEAKIENQARLLNKLGMDGGKLKPLYMNVKSGDTDNREGVAAKIYWNMLFGNSFSRERAGVSPNDLLNYGYTILRAAVSRSLIGSGLLPAFGIFHRNRYNAFPLADDIMEPYRPFVDEIVYELYFSGETELNKETKARLMRLLFADCKFDKVCRPLDVALTFSSASLAKCFSGDERKITYPRLE